MQRGILSAVSLFLAVGWGTDVYAQFGPAKVVTAKAEVRTLPATLTLVGTVEPVTRSLLGAEVAGKVVEMPVRQGDLVEADAVLCRLDDATLKLQLAEEQARRDALRANLEELLNGTRKEDLARLKADLDGATALAERWAFELERIKGLYGSAYANEKEYQDAYAQQRSFESRRLAAAADYEEAVAGPRTETIAQARFAVAEQQAVVDRLTTDLAKTRIRAPYAGYVTRRDAEVGNWLSVGASVVELVDLSSVLVRVDVPESAIPFALVGASAKVRIDALKASFSGTIKHVIPQADVAARTFPVEVEVANPKFALKAGMFARATVPSGSDRPTLAVPKDALIDGGTSIKVAMIVPGKKGKMAIPTPVTLGADAGDWIAITSGNLPPDAEVAIYGNERLLFPQPVEVVATHDEVDASVAPHGASPEAREKTPAS